jgi:predicted GNAT family acetyltransferase
MLKTVFTKVVTAMAVAAALEVALVDIQPTQAANLSFDAGKPIPLAISALYLDAGVAGIYFVATLPEARGKGFATQLVLDFTLRHLK